jgi:hypothetical protein
MTRDLDTAVLLTVDEVAAHKVNSAGDGSKKDLGKDLAESDADEPDYHDECVATMTIAAKRGDMVQSPRGATGVGATVNGVVSAESTIQDIAGETKASAATLTSVYALSHWVLQGTSSLDQVVREDSTRDQLGTPFADPPTTSKMWQVIRWLKAMLDPTAPIDKWRSSAKVTNFIGAWQDMLILLVSLQDVPNSKLAYAHKKKDRPRVKNLMSRCKSYLELAAELAAHADHCLGLLYQESLTILWAGKGPQERFALYRGRCGALKLEYTSYTNKSTNATTYTLQLFGPVGVAIANALNGPLGVKLTLVPPLTQVCKKKHGRDFEEEQVTSDASRNERVTIALDAPGNNDTGSGRVLNYLVLVEGVDHDDVVMSSDRMQFPHMNRGRFGSLTKETKRRIEKVTEQLMK